MEADTKCLNKWKNEIVKKKAIRIDNRNNKNLLYMFFTLIIVLNFIFFSIRFIRNKINLNNLYKNININGILIMKTKNFKKV